MYVAPIQTMDLSQLPSQRKITVRGGFPQAMQQAALAGLSDLESMFTYASQATGVSADLLKAVAKAESDFNQNCVSHCGASGIMQLMPETARSVGVTDVTDPAQNILGGARYLRQMLDRYDGDTTLALAAYNAGPGAVDRYGGVPPYAETQNYVRKISRFLGTPLTVPASSGRVSSSAGQGSGSTAEALSQILDAIRGQDLLADSTQLFCEGLKTAVQNQLLQSMTRSDNEEDTRTF